MSRVSPELRRADIVEDEVGLNLETMQEMKDQYVDKQREHLRNYRALQMKFKTITILLERVMSELLVQDRTIINLKRTINDFRSVDEELNNYYEYFKLEKKLDIKKDTYKTKRRIYKEMCEYEDRLNECYIQCDAINHEPLDDGMDDLTSSEDSIY